MARPETPYDVVVDICRKLDAKGQDPTYGLVAAELPGNPSKGTVLKHIRAYKEKRDLAATVETGLSESFILAARAEIANHITRTTDALGKKVEGANQAADEALAELDKSEARAEALEENLKTAQHLAEQYRQAGETAAAVAEQNSQNLTKRILDLEQERDQLIKAGEASRTEAAKAQMQLERADKAASLAEERNKTLEQKIADLAQAKNQAEQQAAVAVARVEESKEKTAALEAGLKETKAHNLALEKALEETRQAATASALQVKDAEGRAAVAEQKAADLVDKVQDLKAALQETQGKGKG